ncbi:unnamed protein product [marine sediment metagenome]|uniref:Ribosomal protein S27a domain-containing protein n=1 Tax=marine sediment metagenome TaxID=412755 RepID=X1IK26_9ZZZZ
MNNIKKSNKKDRQPVCSKCGCGHIYFTNTKIVCRRCGHVEQRGNAEVVNDA